MTLARLRDPSRRNFGRGAASHDNGARRITHGFNALKLVRPSTRTLHPRNRQFELRALHPRNRQPSASSWLII